ncbi:hypothetical protein D9611_012225 [Ephemerocybe angulata]|uniref:Methyltransferase domain-containing protein n=1 Tax=Ephemerocybe angulata TaxID=980116 RepID=A0A8H5FGE7_9AGAR|nr:hypothetical protein D9611_012225 [Tulosesus angulatus]
MTESAYYDPYQHISDSDDELSEEVDDYEMGSSICSDQADSQDSASRVSSKDDMSISDVPSSFHEKNNRVLSPIPRASTMSSYSYHSSEQFRTPSPSNQSLTPSMRDTLVREEFGRYLNTMSDVYRLPADEEEMDRLEKQHNMLIDIFGAKYPPPMGVALRQGHYEPTKKVLDLGCGSGGWIKDVCRDFPYCTAIAVDLVPISEDEDFPDNLRMEIDDLNKGIEHFYDQFDVVHSRLIAFGIRDYHRLVEHVARVLRPNGLIELQEYDFQTYSRDRMVISANTTDPLGTHPWWATFLAHLREAVIASGGDTTAATNIQDWIQGHEAFENIVYKDVWLPVIPGNCRRYQEDIYTRMKDDVMAFLRSSKPLILGNGVSEQRYEYLVHHTVRELNQSNVPHHTSGVAQLLSDCDNIRHYQSLKIKIKCDKQTPCQSYQRRGCTSLCPNGSLSTVQGTQYVAHLFIPLNITTNTTHSVRQLEDPYARLQAKHSSEPHPLLHADPISAPQPSNEWNEDVTMAVSDNYYEPVAGPIEDVSGARETVGVGRADGPTRGEKVGKTGDKELIDAFGTLSISQHDVSRWEVAVELCRTYFTEVAWVFRGLTRGQVFDDMLPVCTVLEGVDARREGHESFAYSQEAQREGPLCSSVGPIFIVGSILRNRREPQEVHKSRSTAPIGGFESSHIDPSPELNELSRHSIYLYGPSLRFHLVLSRRFFALHKPPFFQHRSYTPSPILCAPALPTLSRRSRFALFFRHQLPPKRTEPRTRLEWLRHQILRRRRLSQPLEFQEPGQIRRHGPFACGGVDRRKALFADTSKIVLYIPQSIPSSRNAHFVVSVRTSSASPRPSLGSPASTITSCVIAVDTKVQPYLRSWTHIQRTSNSRGTAMQDLIVAIDDSDDGEWRLTPFNAEWYSSSKCESQMFLTYRGLRAPRAWL